MKTKLQTILLFFICFLSIFQQKGLSQNSPPPCETANMLVHTLTKYHIDPVKIDMSFKDTMIKRLFDNLDPKRIYFHEEQIKHIKNQPILFDNFNTISCNFIEDIQSAYRDNLEKTLLIIEQIEKKELNYDTKESINVSNSSEKPFMSDSIVLSQHIRKWIKYRTLYMLYLNIENDSSKLSKLNFSSRESETRKKVIESEKCKIQRIISTPEKFQQNFLNTLLNTITSCYDPHSAYFSKAAKKRFEEDLAKTSFSLGIAMEENEDSEFIINNLVPGGPAWKSNELNVGDKIIDLQWPNGKKIDLTCNTVSDISKEIRGASTMKFKMTVRKVNGKEKEVTLVKEKMEVDDNSINSYILNSKHKIGYIYLPGFYTEFENAKALGCANDVAKEIIKLKREEIDGIILDLRNNGGGSIYEAIGLAGIFIDYGPMSIYEASSKEKPLIIKDMNKGRIYSEPLIILINRFSASASEILAAALQNHNRALIVGSPTFGKSTGQIILPIDTTLNINSHYTGNELTDYGHIKLTMNKYYGINGSSHQGNGVIPDIELPDEFLYTDYKESSLESYLQFSSIDKSVKFTPLPDFPVDSLSKLSNSRVKENIKFEEIFNLNDSISAYYQSRRNVILDTISFSKNMAYRRKLSGQIKEMGIQQSDDFVAKNLNFDKDLISLDASFAENNENVLKSIQKDIFIEETINIMNDLLDLTK